MSNKDRGAYPSPLTTEYCPGLSKLEYMATKAMCALLAADLDGKYDNGLSASLYKKG